VLVRPCSGSTGVSGPTVRWARRAWFRAGTPASRPSPVRWVYTCALVGVAGPVGRRPVPNLYWTAAAVHLSAQPVQTGHPCGVVSRPADSADRIPEPGPLPSAHDDTDPGVHPEPVTGDHPQPGHPGARHRLRVDTGTEEHQATTRLLIDGVDLLDLLDLQQPAVHPDGSPRRAGPIWFLPPDPVGLLPPDSPALLPTAAGTSAMVGICTCGEPGCSSLWLRVSRDGDTVVWAPDPDSPGHTVDRVWRFDLLPYLDAVDTAAAAALAAEDLPRRLARELRRRRDHLHYDFWFPRSGIHLLDARAWPGIGEVHLTLATPAGVVWPAVAVVDGESADEFCLRVAHLDPHHPPPLPPRASDPEPRQSGP